VAMIDAGVAWLFEMLAKATRSDPAGLLNRE
jgi:hypothetical protein